MLSRHDPVRLVCQALGLASSPFYYQSKAPDETELRAALLRLALQPRQPGSHHSDQGVQYAAKEYVELLLSLGCQISMATVGKPEANGYAERLMPTLQEEHVDLSEYGKTSRMPRVKSVGSWMRSISTSASTRR